MSNECMSLPPLKLESRPWKFQDLLDDLQDMIDEEPNTYMNFRRETLCMAKDYLEDAYMSCEGCVWAERKRPQKCSCCRRNLFMKDCFEKAGESNV